MIKFTKTNSINGTIKGICVHNGCFMDDETGEIINLAEILEQQYGDLAFDIKTSRKDDSETN